MKLAIWEDLLIIIRLFLLILFGEMDRIVAFLFEKTPITYQKILEKREMSFRSSENKNWTFRGSFDNFSLVFLRFYIIINKCVFVSSYYYDEKTR